MVCAKLTSVLNSKMIRNTPNLFGNVMIGASAGAFLLSALLATVVFDKPPKGTDAYVPEIEMAMAMDPFSTDSEVWINGPLPMHVTAKIISVSKIDKNGNEKPGGIADLFPVKGPATGKCTAKFKIQIVDKSKIPSFANMTYVMIPMFYVRQSSFTEFKKSLFKFAVICMHNMGFLAFLNILWGFALTIGGSYIVYKARRKNNTPKRKVVEPPVNVLKEMPQNSLLVP